MRPRLGQLGAGGNADRAAGAGDERDLPRERFFRLLAEFRLLEAPVLHLEQLGIVERLVPAHRFRGRLDAQRVLRDVGRDGGVLARLSRGYDSEARDQEDARIGIELLAGSAFGPDLLGEVRIIGGTICLDRRAGLIPGQHARQAKRGQAIGHLVRTQLGSGRQRLQGHPRHPAALVVMAAGAVGVDLDVAPARAVRADGARVEDVPAAVPAALYAQGAGGDPFPEGLGDGVRDGELAPSPAEPVAAARTGWL